MELVYLHFMTYGRLIFLILWLLPLWFWLLLFQEILFLFKFDLHSDSLQVFDFLSCKLLFEYTHIIFLPFKLLLGFQLFFKFLLSAFTLLILHNFNTRLFLLIFFEYLKIILLLSLLRWRGIWYELLKVTVLIFWYLRPLNYRQRSDNGPSHLLLLRF